jgi:hypothetical protein
MQDNIYCMYWLTVISLLYGEVNFNQQRLLVAKIASGPF